MEVTRGSFYCENRGYISGNCILKRPHDVAQRTAIKVAQYLSERGGVTPDDLARISKPANSDDYELLLWVIEESPYCDWDWPNYHPHWDPYPAARSHEPHQYGYQTKINGDVKGVQIPETLALTGINAKVEHKLLIPVPRNDCIYAHIRALKSNPLCFSNDLETVKQLVQEIREYFQSYSGQLKEMGVCPSVESRRPLHKRDFTARDLSALIELISTTQTIVFQSGEPSHMVRTQVTSTYEWKTYSGSDRNLIKLTRKNPGKRIPTLYIEQQDYQALEREQERLRTTNTICRCTLF